jgi:hypothetical protein
MGAVEYFSTKGGYKVSHMRSNLEFLSQLFQSKLEPTGDGFIRSGFV